MGGGRRDRGCERFGVVGADTVDRRRVDPEARRNLREIDGRKVAADVFALVAVPQHAVAVVVDDDDRARGAVLGERRELAQCEQRATVTDEGDRR